MLSNKMFLPFIFSPNFDRNFYFLNLIVLLLFTEKGMISVDSTSKPTRRPDVRKTETTTEGIIRLPSPTISAGKD